MCPQAPHYPIKNVFPGYTAKRKRFHDKLGSKRSRPFISLLPRTSGPFQTTDRILFPECGKCIGLLHLQHSGRQPCEHQESDPQDISALQKTQSPWGAFSRPLQIEPVPEHIVSLAAPS